jgi:hypothetical protein
MIAASCHGLFKNGSSPCYPHLNPLPFSNRP